MSGGSTIPWIYDPIRKKEVKATAEELVRQSLIKTLLDQGFPPGLISVERQLSDLVPSAKQKVPLRRVDVVCFAEGTLKPLILIECKAVHFTLTSLYQVIGYNQFLQAPFIAVANQHKIVLGWYHQKEQRYVFADKLPHYRELLKGCVCNNL